MAVSLSKGQRISLEKEAGGTLTRVVMGLGWDAVQPKGFLAKLSGPATIDLDASCLMFDDAGNLADTVWFRQLKSRDGSIVHSGDNLTGEGDGDDEQIAVDLSRIPAGIRSLLFVVNSFTGQTFNQVDNAFCRLVEATSGREIAKYALSGGGSHTAQVMAKVYRHNGEWKMHAIGESAAGRTFHDLLPTLQAHL